MCTCIPVYLYTCIPVYLLLALALPAEIPSFACVVLKINSVSFGVPASRPRIYILAGNLQKATIVTPMRAWPLLLEQMCASMPKACLEDLLFDDCDVRVRRYEEEMTTSLQRGGVKGWDTCKALHDRIRKGLGAKLGRVVLGVDALAKATSCKLSPGTRSALTEREMDCYGLHMFAAAEVLQDKLDDRDMVIDVTNNANMAAPKHESHQGHMACLLRSHKYIHTKRGRLISGFERMLLQGFSRPLTLAGTDINGNAIEVSERQLCALAGDTMSVPVMAALVTVLFACCALEAPSSPPTVGEAEEGTDPTGSWVVRRPEHKFMGTAVDVLPQASVGDVGGVSPESEAFSWLGDDNAVDVEPESEAESLL